MKKRKEIKKLNANERLIKYSNLTKDEILVKFSINGLTPIKVEHYREKYGINKIKDKKHKSLLKRVIGCFLDPFSLVLIALGIFTIITDLVISSGDNNPTSTIIIFSMVFISGGLQFIQETKSNNAASKLNEYVETSTLVERNSSQNEIPLDEVVCYDIVHLRAGDIIPADARVLYAKDFFVSQSSLTGESEPIEKSQILKNGKYDSITERDNLIFMSTTVVSGYAIALVLAVGEETYFGTIASKLSEKREKTSFEKGIKSVSLFLIRIMLVVVPIIFITNGLIKNDWLEALFFAISIAVGLTPEMLPTIVTSSLAKGAYKMSKKKVIVKNLNAIQNFGAMDILCTDKTGTLTLDKVVVENHLDVMGKESLRVLRHAFLNSYFQTGQKNLLDKSIIEKVDEYTKAHPELKGVVNKYQKVDEIPFDFERRRMSTVIEDKDSKTQLITKGAIEEMLSICTFVEYENEVRELTKDLIDFVIKQVAKYNALGYRVIAVAQKNNPKGIGEFSSDDENDMVLIGFLTFLDPPKETTKEALKAIKEYGVSVKVLTGDNEKTTAAICKMVGIKVDKILLGSDISQMDDNTLSSEAKQTDIFAKLSPTDKSRVVEALKVGGHTVGFMGDGINDAPALKVSDVSISVDTASDIAKESADIILLEKDLNVLKEGVIEGRITFTNMMKYIGITVSSNFGNIFAILIASIFLPFLPMLPMQLLLLNLVYDITCITLPFDHVLDEYIKKPKTINSKNIFRFMIAFGPISSIFDITTFVLLYFVLCPYALGGNYHELSLENQVIFIAMFRAGWFIESMWSQSIVIFSLRTKNVLKDRPSIPVIIALILGITILTIIPFSVLGKSIDFHSLPAWYFLGLGITVLAYIGLVSIAKKIYLRHNKDLI